MRAIGIGASILAFGLVSLVGLAVPGCTSAPPVPGGATALRDDVYVQPVAPGVWRHVSFRWYPATGPFPSNGIVARAAGGGALVIDTAWDDEQTAAVLDWVERDVGPVSALVVTHAHDDRLGGIREVHARGIETIALQATGAIAVENGWPPVARAVDSGFRLDALGVPGELFFPGPGHTVDNAVVHLEEPAVLAGSCMVRAAASTSVGNLRDADLSSWPASIRALQRRYGRARVVVPGHGEPGGVELLGHTLDLLSETPPAAR